MLHAQNRADEDYNQFEFGVKSEAGQKDFWSETSTSKPKKESTSKEKEFKAAQAAESVS